MLALLCASSWAQQSNIISGVSPKLKKFISNYPEAAKIFTNAISDAFSNKTVRLYYFYSNDESEVRYLHYYPNTVGLPEVALCIRENQCPLDEFIGILYETINSKNESAFTKLSQEAYLGTISKEQFSKHILQYEFEAGTSTRAALLTLKLRKAETDESDFYHSFTECPTNFDDFLPFCKKVYPQWRGDKDYEIKYDSLRKMYSDFNSASNSPVKN